MLQTSRASSETDSAQKGLEQEGTGQDAHDAVKPHHGIETEGPVRELESARQNYFQG
jgi:hypothetical protein